MFWCRCGRKYAGGALPRLQSHARECYPQEFFDVLQDGESVSRGSIESDAEAELMEFDDVERLVSAIRESEDVVNAVEEGMVQVSGLRSMSWFFSHVKWDSYVNRIATELGGDRRTLVEYVRFPRTEERRLALVARAAEIVFDSVQHALPQLDYTMRRHLMHEK